MMVPRHVQVIFCDDIRQEVGNKFSLMGIYQDDLQISEIPAVLPKLCMRITLVTPIGQPFGKAIIRVYLDEELLLEMANTADDPVFQSKVAAARALRAANEDSTATLESFTSMVTMSPFQISKEGTLRVKVETEDGELRASSLRLKLVPAVGLAGAAS